MPFRSPSAANSVLITGCASGIGKATALRLARSGEWRVWATARRPDSLGELAAAGCRILALDVDDENSMRAAVAAIEAEDGVVSALVNNAGYQQSGAVEEVPVERLRRQFETNVFGPMRLTQLVVPGMRRQGWGRIVNMSSMGGKLTFPGGGAYHGSKHALEALSDALRFELGGFGIDVVVIEPGLIRTAFGPVAVKSMEDGVEGTHGPYAKFNAALARSLVGIYERGIMARFAERAGCGGAYRRESADRERPRTRYKVSLSAHLFLLLRKLASDRQWDWILARSLPRPGT